MEKNKGEQMNLDEFFPFQSFSKDLKELIWDNLGGVELFFLRLVCKDWKMGIENSRRTSLKDKIAKIKTEVDNFVSQGFQLVKITLIGDSQVGKTCFVTSYCCNSFAGEYSPTERNQTFSANVTFEEKKYFLRIVDTGGSKECKESRLKAYEKATVVLACFSVASPSSLDNLKSFWIPEVREKNERVKLKIVGLKYDLSYDEQFAQKSLNTKKKAETLALEVGAHSYSQCSALTYQGLYEAVNSVIRLATSPEKEEKKCCLF